MNRGQLLDTVTAGSLKEAPDKFRVGDSVKVHTRVVEGDKERIQVYAGLVIGRKGRGINETVTVRRISYGEGVERVFPVHSPRVAKIEIERPGRVRRARLNYLRDRKGKQAMAVKEARQEASTTKKGKAAAKKRAQAKIEPSAEAAE
ncbi:MAG: 50S ribosomal protein L19 [Verrucomicrobiales bacterium]